MAISTLVTVGVWSAITWKPIWIAAGPTGDKILTVVPLFVSTAWPVALIWIWSLSQKPQSQIAKRLHRTTPAQIVLQKAEGILGRLIDLESLTDATRANILGSAAEDGVENGYDQPTPSGLIYRLEDHLVQIEARVSRLIAIMRGLESQTNN